MDTPSISHSKFFSGMIKMHQILMCLELRRITNYSRQYEEAMLTSFWVGDADEKG